MAHSSAHTCFAKLSGAHPPVMRRSGEEGEAQRKARGREGVERVFEGGRGLPRLPDARGRRHGVQRRSRGPRGLLQTPKPPRLMLPALVSVASNATASPGPSTPKITTVCRHGVSSMLLAARRCNFWTMLRTWTHGQHCRAFDRTLRMVIQHSQRVVLRASARSVTRAGV